MACTMPQRPRSTVAFVPPYMNSQSSMMGDTSQPNSACSSPQAIPLSPCPSQGERRPSRAQKGKRVHLCEYSGCGKVYTRAEHRRRHELIHKSKKLHACPHEGCTKSFHRADYLAQHIARQQVTQYYVACIDTNQTTVDPSRQRDRLLRKAASLHSSLRRVRKHRILPQTDLQFCMAFKHLSIQHT